MANNLNFFRGKYSDYLALNEVLDTNLYFTIPDEGDKIIENDPKSKSYCLFQGTVLLACSTNYEDIQTALADIAGLQGDLASLEERIGKISSELATYEIKQVTGAELAELGVNVKEAYALYKITPSAEEGKEATEEQVGDVVKIYKDSALQSVELSGQTLVFTYLTVSGGTEVVPVDVSTFLAEAEFGDGLQVVNHVAQVKAGNGIEVSANGVAAKVATATKANTTPKEDANKNFLSVDTNGLAVKSVDSDATVLHQNLTIAGLPSEGIGAGNYQNGQVISAGTSLYTILENILCKENYPTIKSTNYQSASITSKIGAPTVTLSKSGIQLYGTDETLTVTCGNLVVTTTPNKITGLTNGYSAADDDEVDVTATTITKNVSSAITDNNYDITVTFTGFTNQSQLQKSGTTDVCKYDKETIGKVSMGANQVWVNLTGPVVSGHADGFASGYTVSNLGKTDSGHTFSGKSEYNRTLARPTSGASASVTGVLPCYINVSNGTLTSAATTQMTLITGKTFTNISVPSESIAQKHFMFDFPADRDIESAKVTDPQGKYVPFEAAYSKNTIVEKTINGIKMNYKRFQTEESFGGVRTWEITLTTNLSSANLDNVLKTEEE